MLIWLIKGIISLLFEQLTRVNYVREQTQFSSGLNLLIVNQNCRKSVCSVLWSHKSMLEVFLPSDFSA